LKAKTKAFKPAQRAKTLYWFSCEKNYKLEDPESILGKIWLTPKDDEFRSISPQQNVK